MVWNANTAAQLVDGLISISETDAPFEVIDLGPATVGLQGVDFRAACQAPKSATVEIEQGVDDFFKNTAVPQSWHDDDQKALVPRFAAVKQYLEKELSGLATVRVGEVQIHVFLVGLSSTGRCEGFKTFAVET